MISPRRLRPPTQIARLWLAGALLLYLGLAVYQLGLPGLHYDEAKEAGVNAMELLTGAPVSPFRDAGLSLFGVTLPLMVQDYIGALNVYLALPFLALTGIGVPNLRALPVLTGLAALLLLERAVSEWVALGRRLPSQEPAPISLAGLLAVTLLAASPSFVFWSRQGIFVTNLTQPFTLLCVWQGLAWLRRDRPRALLLSAAGAGLAIYAKLLALWVVGPFALLVATWILWRLLRSARVVDPQALPLPALSLPLLGKALLLFLLALSPLILFNLMTGGTVSRIGGNLGQSYYGVNNGEFLANLGTRLGQLIQVLRGDQFWYLGGVQSNPLAPFLAGLALLLGLAKGWRAGRRAHLILPLALLALAVVASTFTVSDLFVTHYALLHVALAGVLGLALAAFFPEEGLGSAWKALRGKERLALAGALGLILWLLLDGAASLGYHRLLGQSGGLGDHSDASYALAYHLRYNGLGSPIALDWGMDAPVRFLSQGTVTPIEIFGYDQLEQPDPAFVQRLGLFLGNPQNVYLLHAPGFTVFQGRRQAFLDQAHLSGGTPILEKTFSQRDGTPLFELWRVVR